MDVSPSALSSTLPNGLTSALKKQLKDPKIHRRETARDSQDSMMKKRVIIKQSPQSIS